MNIYKRGNTWWYRYQVDGKSYRGSCHTAKKAVAEQFVRGIRTAKEAPTIEEAIKILRIIYRAPEQMTVGILLDSAWTVYLDIAKSIGRDAVKPNTLKMRRLHLGMFVSWLKDTVGTVKTVEAVTPAVAARYAAHLMASGAKAKTRINIISDITNVWNMLKKASAGVSDVWEGLRPSNTDGERYEAFTDAQEKAVMEAAKSVGKEWFEVCTVARHTGLRYEDIALLSEEEVSFGESVIRLNPKKTARHGISVTIPMIQEVVDVLKDLKPVGGQFFPTHFRWYGDNSQKRQRALSFREVLKVAGLYGKGNYTFHSWRHTAATRLAEAGAPIETRKLILGHTVDATARRYDHDEHIGEKLEALKAASGR